MKATAGSRDPVGSEAQPTGPDAQRTGPGSCGRHLLRLGIDPRGVHLVTRSRKGSWRISSHSLVQAAPSNRWLAEQGLPSPQPFLIAYHHPETARG